MEAELDLTATQVLRIVNPAPAGGSDPKAEAAHGAQLVEADRQAYARAA